MKSGKFHINIILYAIFISVTLMSLGFSFSRHNDLIVRNSGKANIYVKLSLPKKHEDEQQIGKVILPGKELKIKYKYKNKYWLIVTDNKNKSIYKGQLPTKKEKHPILYIYVVQ